MDQINDYIVLSKSSGTAYNGGFKYNIPATWYSNQRSSVSTVELIQLYQDKDAGHDMAYIATNLGLQNQFVANGSDGRSILAVLANNTTNGTYLTESMNLLTPARPTEIIIDFYDVDASTKRNPDNFVLTLKFSYYNSKETADNLVNQFTPSLTN